MSFGFDPSIILSGNWDKAPSTPSINETLQTMSQLRTAQGQQRQQEATLQDLARQQGLQQQLQDIYKRNAGNLANLPTDLYAGGFGPEARAEQDQAAQMTDAETKREALKQQLKDAHRKHVGELFSGVTDQPSWDAARKELGDHPDPMISVYGGVLPQQFDPAVAKKLGGLALTAKERADLEDKSAGRTETALHDRNMEARLRAGGGGGGGGASPDDLSPQALEDFATQLHTTGQMPPGLGMGKSAAALRVKIANRAAELYGGTDLGGVKAGYKADTTSLTAQQKLADSVGSFESTARKNLKTFLDQADKAADTGSPLFNAPYREFRSRVLGDPTLSGFEAARQTAATEIAKVLQGSTGGGGLTEGARNEVEKLFSPDATVGQLRQAAKVLLADLDNRKKALADQIKETRTRMSGKPAKGEGPVQVKSDADYEALSSGAEFIDPDGKRRRKP